MRCHTCHSYKDHVHSLNHCLPYYNVSTHHYKVPKIILKVTCILCLCSQMEGDAIHRSFKRLILGVQTWNTLMGVSLGFNVGTSEWRSAPRVRYSTDWSLPFIQLPCRPLRPWPRNTNLPLFNKSQWTKSRLKWWKSYSRIGKTCVSQMEVTLRDLVVWLKGSTQRLQEVVWRWGGKVLNTRTILFRIISCGYL